MHIIGEKILNARKLAGKSQAEISRITGISRSYLSDIEQGRYLPSIKTLVVLAKAVELDLSFLNDVTDTDLL